MTRFRPDYALTQWAPPNGTIQLHGLKEAFVAWLQGHVKDHLNDVEAENKWSEWGFNRAINFDVEAEEDDNSVFNMQEAEAIQRSLQAFREEVIEKLGLLGQQQQNLDRQLNYLNEASRRVGRKDWILLGWGVLLSIASNLALDPDQNSKLIALYRAALATLQFFKLLARAGG